MIRIDGTRATVNIDGTETELTFLSAADAEAFATRAGAIATRADLEAACHSPHGPATEPAAPTAPAAAQLGPAEDVELTPTHDPTPTPPPATVTATWRESTRRLTVTLHPVADTVVHRFIDGRPATTPTFNLAAGIDSTRAWTMAPGQTLTLRWGAPDGPTLFETTIPGA